MTVSNPGGPAVVFTGAYDAAGALIKQTMPGGITQQFDYDSTGNLDTLTYDRAGPLAQVDD